MAALQSYGVTKVEELIVYDIKGSLDRAYEEALESDKLFDIEVPSAQLQTIKIFDADDNLVLSVVMEKDGVVEDEKAKKMLNRAEFLASYSNTSIYKLID
ncbi:hypothetical protein GCM10011340_16730 [Roseivirga thermotolerans]|uniref:Uncharacterized protein n=2 Tax=Roseivirgaceae TaxID=2762306 RepID=A0ABQ3I6M6_9BACT|nr:hypothetical protein GCM10011340_16730 [Roseivirga thermotolerans]